ncbi:hypothetical protein PV328_001130 [Microctonus aethiopoides]|uniref:Uncharacterized protein n=1 Tax=Microctonus aethiopoides TaxID=144406 RepID=A0AA39FWN4_9HYME|nr:hypothetical protein PV328_001130 [Microctonus aethiopoides]
MDLETTTTENDVHLKMQCCVDEGTQVDFLDLEINTNCNLLVCNRFVNIEACEAETQTFLQFDTAGKNASVTSNTCDKLCGTDILGRRSDILFGWSLILLVDWYTCHLN